MDAPDIDAAAQFLAASGRVLDQRRFERLCGGGDVLPVRQAVAAYRNADGGFGHGLEPDGRAPGSQPAAVELALRNLDDADAWDDDLAAGACDWLQANAPAEGGAVFVLDAIRGWPHAPWWVPEDGGPASLITTGMIAGTLHASGIRHPWLDRATALAWSRADDLASAAGYDMRGLIRFLNHVPDRDRAEEVLDRAGQVLHSRGLVALDPGAPGEVMTPLDFAPLPGSRARRLFSEATIEAHLDHLAAGQADDGGWTFNWPAWSPAAERDWRGSLTVDALHVLRAHGRLAS